MQILGSQEQVALLEAVELDSEVVGVGVLVA